MPFPMYFILWSCVYIWWILHAWAHTYKGLRFKGQSGGFLLFFFLFFSFCLKVDSSSSDIPGFTFLAQYPEARFRDGHGHHSINVFYGQAAAGCRLFFMLSGRVQHGHLLGVKTLTAMLSLMGTFCNETKIYKDVCEESFLLHMVRT